MFRKIIALSSLFIMICASAVQADGLIPEHKITVYEGTDFKGSDLQFLFDTTLDSCEQACKSIPECQGFTFNYSSSACFPKNEIVENIPFPSAISVRKVAISPAARETATENAQAIDFLTPQDYKRALKQAQEIPYLFPTGGMEILPKAATSRSPISEWGRQVSAYDAVQDWVGLAAKYRLSAEDSTNKAESYRNGVAAALNGYLRAITDAEKADALVEMAKGFENINRGRDALVALRLADSIYKADYVSKYYSEAIAKYGFRIVDHSVHSDQENPKVCATFNQALIGRGKDYAPYIKLPISDVVVSPKGNQLCIEGLAFGSSYKITFREGLPAENGERTFKSVDLNIYVRDRSPAARFAGQAYVLPKTPDAMVPIETVNLDRVELSLYRVSDRNILRSIQDGYFGSNLYYYLEQNFKREVSEHVWTGKGEVQNTLNQMMTTRLPLGDVLRDQPPGLYALKASLENRDEYDEDGATQWFVLSDLGITTLAGTEGLGVFVKTLGAAAPLSGVELTLLSRANSVLGRVTTDADGYARFPAGAIRGTGASAPALVTAQVADDMSFLSLTGPAFDFSDRGVEGRTAAGPVDVFATTDRGAYRAGDTVYVTALARDAKAIALPDLPLTAIFKRPDGVEYSRSVSNVSKSGGHVFALPTLSSVPRGTWKIDLKADPDGEVLNSKSILVEDFVPDRIEFDLDIVEGVLKPDIPVELKVNARYLFGAPGANFNISGRTTLSTKRTLADYPKFEFGRFDTALQTDSTYMNVVKTNAAGQASLIVTLPDLRAEGLLTQARFLVEATEGSGRPVERVATRTVAPKTAVIGIKPLFDDIVPEGQKAGFEIIALSPNLTPTAIPAKWSLNRLRTRYQWYRQNGDWNWEPITTREFVSSGTLTTGDTPAQILTSVDWGRYELVVENKDGGNIVSSFDFYASWYGTSQNAQTPDRLDVSLTKRDYTIGDTATLRILAPYGGTGLITVMNDTVVHRDSIALVKGENLIPVKVTQDWGAGAYVMAQAIRPMDIQKAQNPARAIGLVYAPVAPRDKQLTVSLIAPDQTAPRQALQTMVSVDGLTSGDTAYVTLAAVDVGILNITRFQSPNPSTYYFGQRKLGVEMRDIYGQLLDGMNGAEGRVRSGGDGNIAGMEMDSPPPNEDLVTYFQGPVEVGSDGTAKIAFDIPEFNGTLRLMAVAWSNGAVGQANQDVIVRDPVVVNASLPRFLAPDDQSRLLVDLIHTEGPTSEMALRVVADGISIDDRAVPASVILEDQQKLSLSIPVIAREPGDHKIKVVLTTPNGKDLTKTITLPVRANDPPVSSTQRFTLAVGEEFTLDQNVFAGLYAQDASAFVTAGPLARLDVPGLLRRLDRYPYGCTEQVTSVALPLLYFNDLAEQAGMATSQSVQTRVDHAITKVLTRQSSNGAFGLWYPSSGDFWLDAYVSDFLSRARKQGYKVPDGAFRMALGNLQNRINYAPDFDKGGEEIAYALMVLARERAAQFGDLRYYVDNKASAFATLMAKAQLGAALAMYGDQKRADYMFNLAARDIANGHNRKATSWRSDYGSYYRDAAAMFALASESGSEIAQFAASVLTPASMPDKMSTQEAVWTLLAARAQMDVPYLYNIALNGDAVDGAFVREFAGEGLEPQSIVNRGDKTVDLTLTTIGVPSEPFEQTGYGYRIDRRYFDMDGSEVEVSSVPVGTRLVTVLTVQPFENIGARLMINDPLPAGFEIDNPNLLRAGDVESLPWLKPQSAEFTQFRSDRFLAAVNWQTRKSFDVAYVVRAISPGVFRHPAAIVEDMYHPDYRANTASGVVQITP